MSDSPGKKNGQTFQSMADMKLDGIGEDPYTLSEEDRMLLDVFVPVFMIYKLPSDANHQLIADSLQRGLDNAAEQLPPLAAKIHLDDMGRPLPRTSPAGPLKLNVRTFESGEFMSYDELSQRSFSPADFRLLSLVPYEMANPPARERRICFVQLNFIPGGIILVISLSHIAGDGSSISLAASLICRCTKACMENNLVPQHDYCYDRRPFLPPADLVASQSKEQLIAANEKHHAIKIVDSNAMHAPKKPYDPNPTTCRGIVYRMTGFDAKRLKALCKPIVDGVDYVSTYDSVFALLFMTIMRIRSTINPSLLDKECTFVHAVNLRSLRKEGILPPNYFGNGVVASSTIPLPVRKVIGPDSLSLIASSIRHSIVRENFLLEELHNLVAVPAKLLPHERALLMPIGLPENYFVATSWYAMDVAAWDFGIGRPTIIRARDGQKLNVGYLLPDCQQTGLYELDVYLPEHEQLLLSKDAEFRSWFEVYDRARQM